MAKIETLTLDVRAVGGKELVDEIETISRRQFLKGLTVGAVAGVIAGSSAAILARRDSIRSLTVRGTTFDLRGEPEGSIVLTSPDGINWTIADQYIHGRFDPAEIDWSDVSWSEKDGHFIVTADAT